jgi:predicted NAD/FAD-binding protein
MKIAIIGSGISGLSAAYFLSKKYKVDLFEKNKHFGGHSYTEEIYIDNEDKSISVDLGFIVFNKITYPNLVNFFNELNVPFEKSNMSFSVSVKNSNIEYSGNGMQGLFCNKKNIFNLNFLKMIKEIIFFYRDARTIDIKKCEKETLGEFLKSKGMSKFFINFHIVPMVAAIWSMPEKLAEKIPMTLFLNFFRNHGLLKLKDRPQWYTVSGRSKIYVEKILKKISGECYKNYEIKSVFRNDRNVRLYYGESNEYFDYDQVVFASHANETLRLIQNPTEEENKILSNFEYKNNIAYLHTDNNFMPQRKKAWSSWNSILDNEDANKTCLTYWLNKLQNLKTKNNYFLTLNPITKIEESKIIKKINFTHPFYDQKVIDAQKNLYRLQGVKNSWFCGSYFGYGFHEDGLKSALNIVNLI